MEFDDENIIINNIDDDGSSSLHQTVIKFIGQIFSLLPPSQSSPYKPFPNRCDDTFRKSSKKENDLIKILVLYPRWGNLILRSKTICLYLKKTFLTSLDLLFLDFSFFNLKNYLQFHEASFSLFCHYPDMQKSCFSHNRDDNLAVLKTHVIFHCFAFCVWKNQDGPSLNLR